VSYHPIDHEDQAMTFSIRLTDDERNTLLDTYRSDPDPQLRLRAHIILLLAQGLPWARIAAVLFCSSRTIARWKGRFQQGRLDGLLGWQRGPTARLGPRWLAVIVGWVTEQTPRAFGLLRSRWCCEVVVLLLWRLHRLDVSRETVRRHLHQAGLVWRRPRPVLRREDPDRARILAELRDLLRDLPDDETAVFEDEVDVNLNPKIGCMWMRRGQQAEVVTPGDNAKRYLAGSLHWRTGALLAPLTGPSRNGKLVAAHLEELCRRLRHYTVIHVIWDNAKIHLCAAVREVLKAHPGRLVLHQLPKYAPECNPVERVWWHLRQEITRNHQCRTLGELIDLVFAWLEGRRRFVVEDSVYQQEAQANAA
jgi:putative transposase